LEKNTLMKTHDLKTKEFDKGNYIFRQFETGQEAFIIKSGIVEIIKTTSNVSGSKEEILDTLQAGAVFGEIALIDNKPRMASAKAASDNVSLHVLSKSQFSTMLDATNPFIKKLLTILTTLIRTKDVS
jgi:CRP/FNR family cyclic AMP-dependent transcriptional regulator